MQKNLVDNVSVIEYKGKKIIILNGESVKNKEQSIKDFHDYDRVLFSFKEKEASSIVILKDTFVDKEVVQLWQHASQKQFNQIQRSALVGVNGLMKVIIIAYKAYARMFTKNIDDKLKAFDSIEEAKDWLIS